MRIAQFPMDDRSVQEWERNNLIHMAERTAIAGFASENRRDLSAEEVLFFSNLF